MTRRFALSLGGLFLLAAVSFAQAPPLTAVLFPAAADNSVPLASPLGCCSEPCGCGRAVEPRIWADAEYLLWWFKSAPVNTPLLTLATTPSDPASGQIGSANTRILLGDHSYDPGTRSGGRFTVGGWLDSEGSIGLEGNYLFITQQGVTNTFASNGLTGSPVLAVPFFNVVTKSEDSLPVIGGGTDSDPFPGSAFLHISNELEGTELNVIASLIRSENLSVVGLLGFRYLRFKEDLTFGLNNSAPVEGHFFSAQDDFVGTNNFYAGQLGLRGEYQLGGFFVNATGKVALGSVTQTVDIHGVSSALNPTIPVPGFTFTNVPGGIFALATNSGHHSQNEFAVMPEVDVNVGYNITRNIRAFVGYNFLYLNNVVRPGTTIDRNLNVSQQPASTPAPFTLVGAAAPTFSFTRSDFWAQGVSFGLEIRF